MRRANSIIFLSGRMIALVVLLAFQICLVRVLPAAQYGPYALVFALATLMQTVVSLGIPRVIPRYVSRAGVSLSHATVRRLILWLLAIRVGGSALLMLMTLAAVRYSGLLGEIDPGLVLFGGLFILSGLVQLDADAMAQSLALQRVSRDCTVGEATLRLMLVAALACVGHIHTAAQVLQVSFATSVLACIVLLSAVFRALAGRDEMAAAQPLDRKELRTIALSGYASSMAWFASSPAVVRLIGSHLLNVVAFAGFTFAQSLVLSFQRYTPGMLIFPFIEPAVMKHYARTGDQTRLENALSLVTKIDMILIGATIVGTIVAGRAVVEIMTGGKYGALAYALPWLLAYIVTSSVYRSFEIVAVALGAASALVRTLALSLIWLGIALLLTYRFGLIALLVCPVGDAVSRLVMMHQALHRFGVRHVIDIRVAASVLVLIAALGLAGTEMVRMLDAGRIGTVVIGTAAAIAYLGCLAALRPLRRAEAEIVIGSGERPAHVLLRRYARA